MIRIAALRRPMSAAAAALVLAATIAAGHPVAVAAADPVDFGTPTAVSEYGVSIDFKQPVELATRPSRVELLLRTPASAGPGVIEVDPPTRSGPATLDFSLALADGHIVPNTTFSAQWRVTDANGKAWVGPSVTETYADTRVDWKTLEGDVVRVHWYEGGDDFGQRALKIGDEAVAQTSQLLGVTETEPIDFFIYADQDKFYDALGPSTRENVGGEAHADIRTMFALITPGEINDAWVGVVVPHELTHLVFDTATKNPYHEPPHWLNEGLAVYLSEGYTAGDRNLVENAARSGTIMPLEGLVGAFPTTRDRFFLAYAESVSAVDAIVKNHGRDALIGLIRSYADGVSDDEAFTAALGTDAAGFEKSWLESYGAAAPVRHGPQPAPGGPLPDGWSGAAAPNASIQPGATAVPGSTGGTNSPIQQPGEAQAFNAGLIVAAGLGALAAVGVVVFVRQQRRKEDQARRLREAAAAETTWSVAQQSDTGTTPGFRLPADTGPAPHGPAAQTPVPDGLPLPPPAPADVPPPAPADVPPPAPADVPPPAPAESPDPRPPAPPES